MCKKILLKNVVLSMTFLFLVFTGLKSYAQTISISGKISDEKGSPIVGASVQLKGKAKGALSDADGNYQITNVAAGSYVLTVSNVGFLQEEKSISVSGSSSLTFNFTLKSDTKNLNEVVVIGYGTQKKKDITSAISTVPVGDVSTRPVVSAVEAITGKAAGVQVSVPSGAPGSDLSIKIRGVGSPNGGEPLYVVDGTLVNDIRGLDPSSIATISILKDASAAGIYGAAGSTNGVVIITTKQGTKNKPRTDADFYTGMQQIVKKLPVLDNSQFLSLEQEINGGTPLNIPSYYNTTTTNNNWQDLIYRNAVQTGANVSTSGGTDNGTYYFGIGYLNQDGIIVGTNYTRYNIKMSVEQKATKWLSVGGNLGFNRTNQRTVTDNTTGNFGGVVISALITPEYIPIHFPAGSPNPGVYGTSNFYSGENPLSDIFANTNNTVGNNFLGDGYTEIKLPFDIKYRSQINASIENSRYNYFLDPYESLGGLSSDGSGNSEYSEVSRYSWDNTLSYSKTFGKNSLDVVVGTSALEEQIATSAESATGFASSSVKTLNGASANFALSTANYAWSTDSYFGRVNYSYDDKYLLTATIRRDGSSRVGTNVVWGNFPAASAGWRLSQEDFMKGVTWIQDVKIRAGVGETGNLPPYTILYPSYSLLNAGSPYAYSSGTASPGISPSTQVGNPNLRWESALQENIGFDASFLDHNLTISADYYYKKVKNLIFTEQLPLTTGGSFTALNLPGYDINKGIEVTIDAAIVKKTDFSWDANFNIAANNNLITGIDQSQSFQTGPVLVGGSKSPLYTQIIKDGYSLGTFWGYKALGVNPTTGNEMFGTTLENLGSALPKFTYGFSNNFNYKSFGLSFLIDGSQGNKVYDEPRMETEALSGYANESTAVLGRWEKPGDVTSIPTAINNATTNTAAAALLQNQVSSLYVEDGSFIRLRNISFSYSLHGDILQNLGLGGAKIYVSAQNLVTIDKYKGYYPEVNAFGTGTNNQAVNAGAGVSLLSLGIDRGTYPPAKTFIVGINVQFK